MGHRLFKVVRIIATPIKTMGAVTIKFEINCIRINPFFE